MELRSHCSRFVFDSANRRTERAAERLEQGSRRQLKDLPQCRSLIQRDWSQEDSTSNKMRMHAMILLLLSTSINDDADDDSSSVSIPNTS